jgi:hypothetical protein
LRAQARACIGEDAAKCWAWAGKKKFRGNIFSGLRDLINPKTQIEGATDRDFARSRASKGFRCSRRQFRDDRRQFRMAPGGQGQLGLKLAGEGLGARKNFASTRSFERLRHDHTSSWAERAKRALKYCEMQMASMTTKTAEPAEATGRP